MAIVTPPPRYTVSQWAERFRYLSREYSAQPGRYSLETVPYAREPMDCANDPSVREVVLMWASQTTKTTLLENVLGYFVAAEPAPILLVQPSVEMAQAWSKERFTATCRDTPVLRELVTEQKSRDSGNTIQLKTFPGGNLAIIGSNAPSGLAGRPRRVVLLDEVDRYPASAGTEGDPVALAIRRTESFWNSVVYLTSTPTNKGTSRIEAEYEQTDQRKWFVPCGQCGHEQILQWSQVQWDNDKPETARYVCEKCECHWTDGDRVAALRRGAWKATAPFSGKRGYFLNGIYSPFKSKRGFANRLHQMATEFLEAKKGGSEQLKTWTNTFLAETWADASEGVEPTALTERCEDYNPNALPDSIVFIAAGADVQKDRIEMEIVGLGVEDESWGIEVVKTYGDTERPETWRRFGNELQRRFRRLDGTELRLSALAIDFHFRPATVKQFAKTHGTSCVVHPVIGIGSTQPALTQRRTTQEDFTYSSVATDQAKDVIYSRLRIVDRGPRYMHFPNGFGYDDAWFRQLTCERVVTRYNKGFPKRVYEKANGARNEALDMRVYWLGLVDILHPDVGAIAERLKKAEKPKDERLPAKPRREAWATGWR
jgi:phage terminase large subunit GpA-like protein